MNTPFLCDVRDARDTLRRRITAGITCEDDATALDALCATEYANGHQRGQAYGRLGYLEGQAAAAMTLAAFLGGLMMGAALWLL